MSKVQSSLLRTFPRSLLDERRYLKWNVYILRVHFCRTFAEINDNNKSHFQRTEYNSQKMVFWCNYCRTSNVLINKINTCGFPCREKIYINRKTYLISIMESKFDHCGITSRIPRWISRTIWPFHIPIRLTYAILRDPNPECRRFIFTYSDCLHAKILGLDSSDDGGVFFDFWSCETVKKRRISFHKYLKWDTDRMAGKFQIYCLLLMI